MKLLSPHVPLGIPVAQGLEILKGLAGTVQEEEEDGERSIRADTAWFSVAIFPGDGLVTGVWYDDPLGRNSQRGRETKVILYLTRFGPIENWELRMDNGWMRYWFNPTDRVAMVYGVDMDVLRFNAYGAE